MPRRARLMLGLVATAAIGLIIVDGVFYLELRDYLYQQVDQQVDLGDRARWAARSPSARTARGPVPADRSPRRPPPGVPRIPFRGGPPPGGRPTELETPPGTYGVAPLRRQGRQARSLLLRREGPPAPVLPAQPPISTGPDSLDMFTRARDDGLLGFRAAAVALPGSSRTLVVAVPLGDTDQTLAHVRLIGLIVSGVVLAALAALGWWVIRVGRIQGRSPSARRARGGCGGSSPTPHTSSERRWPRSAATRSSSGSAPTPTPTTCDGDAANRGGVDAHGRARGRPPDAGAPRRGPRACDASRSTWPRSPPTLPPTLARGPPIRPVSSTSPATGATEMRGDPDQLRQVAANLLTNAIAHTPDGTPVEVTVDRRPRRRAS